MPMQYLSSTSDQSSLIVTVCSRNNTNYRNNNNNVHRDPRSVCIIVDVFVVTVVFSSLLLFTVLVGYSVFLLVKLIVTIFYC